MGWLDKYQDGGVIKDERYASMKVMDNIPQTYKKQDKPMSKELLAKIKQQQLIEQTGEISEHKPQGWLSKFTDIATNPMTAFGYAARNERIPDNFTAGPRNATDYALDVINPAQYALDTKNVIEGVMTGNMAQIGEGALGIIPLATEARGLTKLAKETYKDGKVAAKQLLKEMKEGSEELKRVAKWNVEPIKDILTNKDARVTIPTRFMHPNFIEREVAAGAHTLDETLANKIDLLNTPEGKTRLINQEANYLAQNKVFGGDREKILKQAEINADARIFELEHMRVFGNKNLNALEELTQPGTRQIEQLKTKHRIPNYNAHYSSPSFDSRRGDLFIDNYRKDPLNSALVEVGGSQAPGKLTLGHGYGRSKATAEHEVNHALQRTRIGAYDNVLGKLKHVKGPVTSDIRNGAEYFYSSPAERTSFLAELRQAMKDRKLINHDYDEITPDLLKKAKASFTKKPNVEYGVHSTGRLLKATNHRILDFMEDVPENYELISRIMNKLPAAVPITVAGGAAALKSNNEGWAEKYQHGGIIEDDRGQWAHPGEVTKINSTDITMQGVNYPVLGISDTGHQQMMQPGKEYKFEGESVTEYPLQKLNKKTNFTSPNNWLDKYTTT